MNTVTCVVVHATRKWRVLIQMTGFIITLVTISLNHIYIQVIERYHWFTHVIIYCYKHIRPLHNLQFLCRIFTRRLLVTHLSKGVYSACVARWLTLHRSESEFESHCDWRSVSLSVLVSSPVRGSWPDISYYLTVTVFFLGRRPLWRESGSVFTPQVNPQLTFVA
jgi:hypothetical protein